MTARIGAHRALRRAPARRAIPSVLTRLRWATILVPVLVIGLLELLSDTVLDPYLPFPIDTLIVAATVLVIVGGLSGIAFREIDRLGRALRARNAELEAREASARALHRVGMAITALADLDAVLRAVVDNARRLLGSDIALLVLIGPDGEPGLRATSGPEDAFDRTGAGPGDEARRFIRPGLVGSVLAAPLQRGGRTIGTLMVGSGTERSPGVDDLESLASLASQAAIAIENDRLQREFRELAIRAERERIAREMHDGLAQVLGYVNTKSQAVEELLATGQVGEAKAQMAELAAAARSIYVDVREAILGLSSPVVTSGGLVEALTDYAGRFAEASKLAVRIEASDAAGGAILAPDVEANVFRIVQEALTNVRKHAGAHRVTVGIDLAGGELAVTVHDDGRGFDPGAPAGTGDWPQYGLTAIRERAASIGGAIDVTSVVGEGTDLRLVVPVGSAAPRQEAASPSAPAPAVAQAVREVR